MRQGRWVLRGVSPCLMAGGASLFLPYSGWAQTWSQLRDGAQRYIAGEDRDLDTALENYEAVILRDPSHPHNDEILLEMAELLAHGDVNGGTSDPATAIKVLKGIVKKYPETHKAVLLARSRIGLCYLLLGSPEEARHAYEDFLDADTSGDEWADVREWCEELKNSCATYYADTAPVPKDPLITLSQIAEMRKKYGSRPDFDRFLSEHERKAREYLSHLAEVDALSRRTQALPKSGDAGGQAIESRVAPSSATAVVETVGVSDPGNDETDESRRARSVLDVLNAITSVREEPTEMRFELVEAENVPLGRVVYELANAGFPVMLERMGEDARVSFSLTDASVGDVVQELARQDPRYEVRESAAGWSLVLKSSPLWQARRRFEVACPLIPLLALKEVAAQIEEAHGPSVKVDCGALGSSSARSLECPTVISVEGTPYDALDGLVENGHNIRWDIAWVGDDRLMVMITPCPTFRQGRQTVISLKEE